MQDKELEQAMYEYLKQKGLIDKLKLQLTSAVFKALLGEQEEPRKIPIDQAILNELIREYLVFAGYLNTAELFNAEADLSHERLSRDVIEAHLKVEANPRTPLLLALVFPRI